MLISKRTLVFCVLSLYVNGLLAQTPETRLALLDRRHRLHQLADTVYLKSVDSIASQLLSNDSLNNLLAPYQKVAFGPGIPGKFRMHYYTYLALQAYDKNRFGSAIYYSEKNNEEAVRAGIFEKDALPHSDMFALSVYNGDKDYGRAIQKYDSLRTRIGGLVEQVPKMSKEEGFVAIGIMNELSEAASGARDTGLAREAVEVSGRLLAAIEKYPDRYQGYLVLYRCLVQLIGFREQHLLGHSDSALLCLETAIGEVLSPGFIKSIQPYTTFDCYQMAFDFFMDRRMLDSARRYMELSQHLNAGIMQNSRLRATFLLEGSSRLEALEGHYPEAYRDLRKAYGMEDSSYYQISSDKDNNLYALAEVENTRTELLRTEAQGKVMERFNVYLFSVLGLLVLLILSGYLIITNRSRQRMIKLQLSLARNFHDEIGPMLLYANTLAKKESEDHPGPHLEELKGHLVHVMEAVRGITHDLKSKELSNVGTFIKETTALLEKIKETTATDFAVKTQGGSGRVLSHFQHGHLKKISSELISNSIRHSGCTRIQVSIMVNGRHLDIQYSDNGRGMDPDPNGTGIGLQNVKERVALLNGTWRLQNNYPEGYLIDIKIPLL
jgi:signal transduction histidine kinase